MRAPKSGGRPHHQSPPAGFVVGTCTPGNGTHSGKEGVQAHRPCCRTPASGLEPRNEHLSCVAAKREKRQGGDGENRWDGSHLVGVGGCRAGAGASGRPCPLQLSWEMQPASWGTIAATSPDTPGLAGGGPVVSCPRPHADHSPGPPERRSSLPVLARSLLVDTTYHPPDPGTVPATHAPA